MVAFLLPPLIRLLMAPLCSKSTGSEKKSDENGSDDEDDADEPFICSSSEVADPLLEPPPVPITGVVISTIVSNVGPGSMFASRAPSMVPPDTLLKMK